MTDRQPTCGTDPSAAPHEVVWMGMRLRTPRPWEIVSHSVRPARGRLVFVDRRRQRMQLSWAHCDRRPDLRRAFSDYRSRDRQNDPACSFETLPARTGWQGYARGGDEPLTRAGRYIHKRNLWVEIVLTWPDGRDAEIERQILASFALAAPPCPAAADAEAVAAMAPTRWRAFGLDVTAPPGWALTGTSVKPADVALQFAAATDPCRAATVRRLGMIDAWYNGNGRAFLHKRIGYGVDCRFHDGTLHGRPALLAISDEPTSRFKRLTGRGRTRRDLLWTEPEAFALLWVTTWSRDAAPVEPDAFDVEGYLLR